jgi:probable F420-dependent oxidoreductase
MDAPQPMTPPPDVAYAKILAANGPKMLALAGEVADGAFPTLVPPEFTAHARAVLGPHKLLIIGLTCAMDDDPAAAAALTRQFVSTTIGRPGSPCAANLTRLGYSSEKLSEGSDRVVDAVLGHGGPDAIAAKVGEHLKAGADHVRVSMVVPDFASGFLQLERAAPAFSAWPVGMPRRGQPPDGRRRRPTPM